MEVRSSGSPPSTVQTWPRPFRRTASSLPLPEPFARTKARHSGAISTCGWCRWPAASRAISPPIWIARSETSACRRARSRERLRAAHLVGGRPPDHLPHLGLGER